MELTEQNIYVNNNNTCFLKTSKRKDNEELLDQSLKDKIQRNKVTLALKSSSDLEKIK